MNLTRARAASLALLLCALLLISFANVATAGSKSPFRPGLYVGATSQGVPVKIRLTVGGEPCEGKPCVFAPNDEAEINVTETCTPEGSTNEYLDLVGDLVTKSGTVHLTEEGFSKLVATLKVGHDGTLTGKMRATSTLEGGQKCDSGPVTLKAKIGGSTK